MNKYVTKIVQEIKDSIPHCTSRCLSEALGVEPGKLLTILKPHLSHSYLPDYATIKAIAKYKNMKAWEIYKKIEELEELEAKLK